MSTEPATNHYDSSKYLIKRLLGAYIRPHKGRIGLAILCMIVVASASAANAWMMQPLLDKIFLEKNAAMLMLIPGAVIVISLLKGIASYYQSLLVKYVGQRIVTDMQMELYAHMLYADLALITRESSGNLISRFTNDINVLRRSVSSALTGIAREVLTLVFLVALMFYQSFTLAILAFFVFPLAIYPMRRLGKKMRKISHNTQSELGEFTSRLDETFQGIRMVKAYGNEQYEINRSNTIVERLFRLYVKAARTESANSPISETLGGIAVAAVVWYGGSQVLAGTTTPGAFFSFITALMMAYRPVKNLSGLNTSLEEGLAAAKRLFELLDQETLIRDAPNARALVTEGGAIRFQDVRFAYNDPGKPALRGVTLDIPAAATVALVGPSGSGKSTVMNLLLRFYDPASGQITIDGQDIQQVTMASLRKEMAIVSQEVVLFDDTIRANIAYSKPGATEDEIMAAAYAAAAHDFIMELPEGYDTLIGQHGMRLSGGQRQRLAIARAMLRNSPILLLDEATSALDPISEQQIQTALERLMQGRTTLVIAHRLSTVMNADVIYVMKRGEVVESGKHAELLALDGEYARLYATQFVNNFGISH